VLREGQGLTVHVIPDHVIVLPAKYALNPESAAATASPNGLSSD